VSRRWWSKRPLMTEFGPVWFLFYLLVGVTSGLVALRWVLEHFYKMKRMDTLLDEQKQKRSLFGSGKE